MSLIQIRACVRCKQPIQIINLHQKFCKVCAYQRKLELKRKHKKTTQPQLLELNCKHCGKQFQQLSTKQKFCSNHCRLTNHCNKFKMKNPEKLKLYNKKCRLKKIMIPGLEARLIAYKKELEALENAL